MLGRRALERRVDRRQPHAAVLPLGPPAAKEVRAAVRAERLRAASLRRVGTQQLAARGDVDRVAARAGVRGRGAAGQPLAARAVAVAARLELAVDLEADTPAERSEEHTSEL